MEEREYRNYYNQEDTHWWFINRYKIVSRIISDIADGARKEYVFLDIGCGTGGLLGGVSNIESINAFGVDVSRTALNFCLKRGISRIAQADAMSLPFTDESIDIALSCEVMDHVTIEPEVTLKEIYRVCKKGGWFIISDVSFEFLKSEHDKVYHTKHRFNKKELYRLISDAGFKIKKISYYNFLLFPVVSAIRIFRKFINSNEETSSDLKETTRIINWLLIKFLGIERELLKRCNLPYGSSLLCVARKE